MNRKEPLYRRVNARTHGITHGGGDYRRSRHARHEDRVSRGAMSSRQNGLDYTPLFRFLLSRVGQNWHEVRREAAARLDKPDPIFWLVARSEAERQGVVRIGESSYYSGLYVDADDCLAVVDPDLSVDDMRPSCPCCTHTLNGVRFTQSYRQDGQPQGE